MDFVKLYTEVLTHPKWLVLSPRAKAMIVQAWMFAGRHETGGYVPDSARAIIGHTAAADRECEGTWWHRNGAGWVLHDWADHQVDAEEFKADREQRRAQNRERAKRYRQSKKEATSGA